MEIEKNIPIPQRSHGRPSKYEIFDAMLPGDSIAASGKAGDALRQAIWHHAKRNRWTVTMRKTEDGWRVWRLT